MKRIWMIPVAFVALLLPATVQAGGGESGFDGVVRAIENRYHVHAERVPLTGLVSVVSRVTTKNGVGGLSIAEFDDFPAPADGEELNSLVAEKLGAGWERMIRDTSKNEQTLIFVHPKGVRMAMLIVDLEGNELDLVALSVDPKHLKDEIGHYEHHHESADSRNDSE